MARRRLIKAGYSSKEERKESMNNKGAGEKKRHRKEGEGIRE